MSYAPHNRPRCLTPSRPEAPGAGGSPKPAKILTEAKAGARVSDYSPNRPSTASFTLPPREQRPYAEGSSAPPTAPVDGCRNRVYLGQLRGVASRSERRHLGDGRSRSTSGATDSPGSVAPILVVPRRLREQRRGRKHPSTRHRRQPISVFDDSHPDRITGRIEDPGGGA